MVGISLQFMSSIGFVSTCCTPVTYYYLFYRYLLEKRADPHVKDSEMNVALHWSAFAGSLDITADLLNHGANLNVANVHGDTPL